MAEVRAAKALDAMLASGRPQQMNAVLEKLRAREPSLASWRWREVKEKTSKLFERNGKILEVGRNMVKLVSIPNHQAAQAQEVKPTTQTNEYEVGIEVQVDMSVIFKALHAVENAEDLENIRLHVGKRIFAEGSHRKPVYLEYSEGDYDSDYSGSSYTNDQGSDCSDEGEGLAYESGSLTTEQVIKRVLKLCLEPNKNGRTCFKTKSPLAKLHRIGVFTDKKGSPDETMMNIRVGRDIRGPGRLLLYLLKNKQTKDIRTCLILGQTNRGKTTLLRDFVRVLADYSVENGFGSLFALDCSGELSGAGANKNVHLVNADDREHQCQKIHQLYENMHPGIVVIDEVATKNEVDRLREASLKGCKIFATAHAASIEDFLDNKQIGELAGVYRTSVQSGQEVLRRNEESRFRTEMSGRSIFDDILILESRTRWLHFKDVDLHVNAFKSKKTPLPFDIVEIIPK